MNPRFPDGIFRRARFATCLIALALFAGPFSSRAQDSIPGLIATEARPVYPVLIGNEFGPLLRVTLQVGKVDGALWARNDLRLASLSFVLDGTDDLEDLQSLSLVSTEDDENFKQTVIPERKTTVTLLGGPIPPSAKLVFRVDLALVEGKNVFWLSGRLRDSANLSHRIAASCTGIETSAGRLVPGGLSPEPRQRIGIALRKAGDGGVYAYGIPLLATTPKGTLLCVYDMRWNYPADDLQDRITTGLRRSADGGKTWEENRVILTMEKYGGLPPEQNGCSDPGIVVDRQTGEIFCFAVWMHGNPHHHQWYGTGSAPGFEIGRSAQILMIRSRDDGRTWSRPENLTRRLKREAWWLFVPAVTQGIQLADGTLVMPAQGRNEQGWEFSTIMTSRDHGATWTSGTPAFSRASESAAVELGDGSIMLNMRNETEDETYLHRAVFVTRDLGRTWRPHATNLNTLIEPNCNASLLRVDYEEKGEKKHVLLFMNPHRRAKRDRSHHTLQVSFDEGVTWPREYHLLLDEGLGWGYPCLTQIDAGHIGLAYAGSQADVQFQILSLKEILRR